MAKKDWWKVTIAGEKPVRVYAENREDAVNQACEIVGGIWRYADYEKTNK